MAEAGKVTVGVRAAKAAATRTRMLEAARKLFVERGYAATSMQSIATEAGVAVQTLYYTFSTKDTILSELVDAEVAGDTEPVATLDRPWVAKALAADPRSMLEQLAREAVRINSRVAPVLDAVRSAALSNRTAADLWRTNISQRHAVATVFVGALAAKASFRADIGVAQAADIVLATISPETFMLLVGERGWTEEALAEWAADALVRQLLPDPA